jgi:ribose transport system permease protein
VGSRNRQRSPLARIVAKPEFSRLAILAVMFALTAALQQNFFETKAVVRNINAFMPLILMTMGQAVVIISGGLDLSAGTALSLLTCVLTTVMKRATRSRGSRPGPALWPGHRGDQQGGHRLPAHSPVIITFATSYLWLGIGLFLRPVPGGEAVNWFRAFYNAGLVEGVPAWLKAAGAVFPPALVLILIGCALWLIVARTRTGRYLYAVGGNNESAYVSGINTAAVQMRACLLNSGFIFLTALFFVGQNQSGDARMGDPLTLRGSPGVVEASPSGTGAACVSALVGP